MKEITVTITGNRQLTPGTYEMTLRTAAPHGILRPGQFINIKLDGFFLRRPISVCDWTEQEITILYKSIGKGTEAMSRYEPGKPLNILTALGNGFPIESGGQHPLLIGGGAGVPPMYGLCKTLLAEGKTPMVILGFNTAQEIFYREKFEALGVDTYITTADGSCGIKGFVTDAIKGLSFTSFYACGPEAMLRALDNTIDSHIHGWLSFEERMGCGFGACMGCSCETKYGSKRICKEGPVLERREILW